MIDHLVHDTRAPDVALPDCREDIGNHRKLHRHHLLANLAGQAMTHHQDR
jgi:hypothetical protein